MTQERRGPAVKYENPPLPEEINYSRENPLKEMAILLAGALLLLVALVVVLSLLAEVLARQVPFEYEQRWAASVETALKGESLDERELAVQARLQEMAERIAQLQDFPPEVTLTVHLVDDDMVNAFATVGGHLVIMRGMLEKLPHENALVTVLAHEAAHIKHRDPLVALGRGVAVMTALGAVTGFGDGGLASSQMQKAGVLTMLSFNRDQERAADEEALRTLQAWYGYTAGAADLFTLLAKQHAGREPPAFFNSHPATQERIDTMRVAQTAGALRPLPPEIVALRKPD